MTKYTSYNVAAILFAAFGSLFAGYSLSVIVATLGQPTFYSSLSLSSDTHSPQYSHTNAIISSANGIFFAGGFIGCFIAAWAGERFGRLRGFQLAAVVGIIGGAIQAGAISSAMYLVARLLTGIATGQTIVAMPIYFAEIASPKSRGLMTGAHGCFINVGYAVANWVGYGCFLVRNSTFGWRFPNAILVFWALCLLIGSFFIPESPRWLCSRSRHDEALRILCRLHNQPDDPQDGFAYQELEMIQKRMLLDRAESDRYGKWQLFTQPTYRKRTILAAMVLAGSQNTGVLVINNYNALLYQSLGLSNAQALLVSAGYNTWAMVCNCIGASVSDRFGRRKILITGFGMTGIMIAVATALIAKYTETQSKTYAAASVAILYLYVACYGSCIDVNVFTLVTEIFPSHLRAQGTSLATAMFFLTDILWLQLEPTATGRIGWKYYLVFVCLCVVHTVYLYFQLPETSGVALETIDAVFGKETVPSPCNDDREPKLDEERIEIR